MKIWTFGVGVCLLAVSDLSAQASYTPQDTSVLNAQRRLAAFVLEHSLDPGDRSTSATGPHDFERSVVSVRQLQYRMSKDARKLSEKAMREFFQNRFTDALPFLEQAVAIEPHSSVLQNDLGVFYCVLGRDKEAQQAFERAIEADSGCAVSYTNLAAIAFNNYQYRVAERAARQALRFAPLTVEAKVTLGLAEVAQNHWTAEAKRVLEENRSNFDAAEQVVSKWPSQNSAEPILSVHGAGPGAFAGYSAERIRSRLLSSKAFETN